MKLARGLGWFSIGLGLAEVLAPREVGRLIGIPERRDLLRVLGLREIVSGIGILSQPRPAGAVWSRVMGDVMDLALLGTAMGDRKSDMQRVGIATAAVAGVTALDFYCAQKLSWGPGALNGHVHVERSITINRSAEDLYSFWRQFERLPIFMEHLKSVQPMSDGRSHWVAKAPAGTSVEWDAEVVEDKPNELISWRSLENADVENAGTVRFERAPGGRGTVVSVNLNYRPPAGALGATIARLFGESPEEQVPVELLRFKQLMETGEIIKTEGQPAGRSTSTSPLYDDWLRR